MNSPVHRTSQQSMARIKTALIALLSGLGLMLCLAWALISVTAWGKGVLLMMISLSLLPIALRLRHTHPQQRRRWNRINLLLGILAIVTPAFLILTTPTGQPPAGSPVQQRFSTGSTFPRFSLPNIIPEIEQLNLGTYIMPHLDPLLTPERGRRLGKLTLDCYAEMERDANFHALGSAMSGVYGDLLHYDYPPGHYYLYVPRSAPAGPLPAIVYLHGSMGNFKVYTWIWAQLAEKLGCVIIAPSFGFGFWDRPEGLATVQRALADAQTVVPLDPKRIHLAGLSNGGLGVCRLASAMPDQFRGCILISAVMNGSIVNDPTFQQHWTGRPMLFLTGEEDERVPFPYVREHADTLQQAGVEVRMISYPQEDHFLMFSQRQRLMEEIAAWIRAQDR